MPSRFVDSASSGTTSRCDIAHGDAVDLDAVELHAGGLADAVGGLHLDGVVARRRMDAELGGGGFAQRNALAPVSTMKSIDRPSTRASTWKPPPLSFKVTVR